MRDARAVSRLLMVLGMVFLLLGGGFAFRTYSFVHGAVRADATVTGNIKFAAPDGSVAYRPMFQFKDAAGRTRTGEADSGTHAQGYVPGDRIQILYPPDDPYSAQMDAFQQLWLMSSLLGGVGATLLLAGWVVRALQTWVSRRDAR
jgi:hypothetical protein